MILVDPNRFFISIPKINVPNGVEVVWAVISPKKHPKYAKVKNICLASVYISPKSRFKKETIAHIVESIQLMKSYYNNEIKYVISGDFNKVSIEDILDSQGSLQNIQVEPTRRGEILDLIITDIHTLYLPSLTLPPLDVDMDKKGVASDHSIIIYPPANNKSTIIKREKQIIKLRPLPKESINECGKFIATHTWDEIYNSKNAHEKAQKFHDFLTNSLEKFFPQKVVKKSPFDKKWFDPPLKIIHRRKQRKYFKNRKSVKYKKLQRKFNRMKKVNIKSHYVN